MCVVRVILIQLDYTTRRGQGRTRSDSLDDYMAKTCPVENRALNCRFRMMYNALKLKVTSKITKIYNFSHYCRMEIKLFNSFEAIRAKVFLGLKHLLLYDY